MDFEAARLQQDRAEQRWPEQPSTPVFDDDLDRLDPIQRLAPAGYLDRLHAACRRRWSGESVRGEDVHDLAVELVAEPALALETRDLLEGAADVLQPLGDRLSSAWTLPCVPEDVDVRRGPL